MKTLKNVADLMSSYMKRRLLKEDEEVEESDGDNASLIILIVIIFLIIISFALFKLATYLQSKNYDKILPEAEEKLQRALIIIEKK